MRLDASTEEGEPQQEVAVALGGKGFALDSRRDDGARTKFRFRAWPVLNV